VLHISLVVCAKDGIVTLYDALFQETFAQASAERGKKMGAKI